MTMYPSYIRKGRDLILYFLKKHFDDKEHLITPMKPLKLDTDVAELEAILTEDDFKKDYKILNQEIRKMGYNIPPLVNAYMNLSPTMKLFGTAINYGFGDVEETGILIAVDEILAEKRVRHIDTYIKEHPDALLTGCAYGIKSGYSMDGPVDFDLKTSRVTHLSAGSTGFIIHFMPVRFSVLSVTVALFPGMMILIFV